MKKITSLLLTVVIVLCTAVGLVACTKHGDKDHVYVWEEVTPANCIKTGLKKGVCKCGDTIYDSIPVLEGHRDSYKIITLQEATCTEDGNGYYRCPTCNIVISSSSEPILPALGHDWSEWEVTKQPTEAETGTETRKCDRCNKEETRDVEFVG